LLLFTFVFSMITLKKILSALLIVTLLVAVTGVSFSRHVCLSGKSVACAKSKSCCKHSHPVNNKSKCCSVQDFYAKANIVTTHQIVKQKFSTDNFISFFQKLFFVAPSQVQYSSNLIPKPPLLRSCRSILLDSSRLTV
jgi:hypothetical protein